eukprot:5941872-Amphidinium_carterae.1
MLLGFRSVPSAIWSTIFGVSPAMYRSLRLLATSDLCLQVSDSLITRCLVQAKLHLAQASMGKLQPVQTVNKAKDQVITTFCILHPLLEAEYITQQDRTTIGQHSDR